jgi:hypothetical protein
LHGVGERGNGTTELSRVLANAIPRYINQGASMTFNYGGASHSFLVLSPQLSASYGSWENFYVEEMIKYAKQNLRVDTNRIYLCGLSLGGGGTWKYATSSAVAAKQLAAIVPVCGTGEGTTFSHIAQNKVAVWGFHASDDYVVGAGNTTYAVNNINNNAPQIVPKTTFYATGGHGIWDRAFDLGHTWQSPNVYEWMLSYNRKADAPINLPPLAMAGNDWDIMLPANTVHLKGNESFDQDMTAIKYQWTQVSGPTVATISSATTANTVVNDLSAGTYIFRLTVIDMQGATSSDDVTVLVRAAGSGNAKPIAVAGDDITINGSFYACSSYGSNDPDGSITGYIWNKIAGPVQYSMPDSVYASANVFSLTNGTYQFRVQVKDNLGAVSMDTIKVVVSLPGVNIPPVANAGNNITTSERNAVLNASNSTDVDGTLTYSWQQLSGPFPATITNSGSARTAINNLEPGTYTFRIIVTDNKGAVSFDDVSITILSSTGVLPVKWLYVQGEQKNRTNKIVWATANEENNSHFEIQRSDNGIEFNVIGKIAGANSSFASQEYSYTDYVISDKKLYYRLKQVDRNGTYGFSKIVVLQAANGKSSEWAYPNPAQSNVTIAINNNVFGNGTITVFDVSGKQVIKSLIYKKENYLQSTVLLNQLKPGTYLVQVAIGSEYLVNQKLMKH